MREAILEAAKKYLRYIRSSGPNDIGGPCPFHKGGMEKRPSFYISLRTGEYYCHACHASGNFPQFLKRVKAPQFVIERFLKQAQETKGREESRPLQPSDHTLNEGILGIFQYCPVDLVNEGFDPKLLQRMDIGFDKSAMRIIFPIRNIKGELVGLAGRTVIGEYPRYKVYKAKDLLRFVANDPTSQTRYISYDIRNHNHIWNFHNVYPQILNNDVDTLIITEGYKACLWLIQHGIDNTVALMGSRLTYKQEELIGRIKATIIVFLDNDLPGREGTLLTGWRLSLRGFRVLCVAYPEWCNEHTQPDNLDKPDIEDILDGALDWQTWRKQHHALLSKTEKYICAEDKRRFNETQRTYGKRVR